MAETTSSPVRTVKLRDRLQPGVADWSHHQLGDTVTPVNGEGDLPYINKTHLHLPR